MARTRAATGFGQHRLHMISKAPLKRFIHVRDRDLRGGDAIVIAPGEDPSWAPNSRALIFSHGPDHSKKLSLLDVPTKQVKDIARIAESNSQSQPSWAK